MGSKRPYEEMGLEELRFKHSRQVEYSNKPASFSDFVSFYSAPRELSVTDKNEGGSCKFGRTELHEKGTEVKISPPLVEKGVMTSDPVSLPNGSSHEEEDDKSVGLFEGVGCTFHMPDYSEFNFPWRPFIPVDDPYSSSLNNPPRRHIPVGPNHQASIPIWSGPVDVTKADGCEMVESTCKEEKLLGTCVVPMPDLNASTLESGEVGIGRAECCCLDSGSIGCVQKHVGEEREELRKSLEEKQFVNLGFCEMGEEVSCKWTEEEEADFHDVVYSYPASLGRNFWNRLSAVFPSRSKKEIVSYYFNVFMLRKRASQNRTRSLEIDSDDDEWHGSDRIVREVQCLDNEDDPAMESLGDEESESDDDNNSNDGDDCDDNVGQGRDSSASSQEHCVADRQVSKSFTPKSSDEECRFDPTDRYQDDCVFQDDSCLSFECQANMSDCCGAANGGTAFKPSDMKTENVECPDNRPNASSGALDHLYLSDSFDSKVWDARYNNVSSRPGKGFDLLPWDMIEDIFGDGKDDGKTDDY